MSFPGASGDNSVFVSIGGSSMPLVDALSMATDAFGLTSEAAIATSAAFEAMGAASTMGADGLARVTGTAATASAAFDDLATTSRMATSSMATMGGVVGGSGGGGGFGSWVGGAMASMGMGGGLTGMFGAFGDALGGAVTHMMGFIEQAGAMVAGLVSFSVLNDITQEVQGFTDSLIELNVQTEKNQFAWRYLYGGGNTPRGIQTAQQMADWTKSFSMQIPYTRQDLLNAVTTLAPAGLSSQGLEHYMPMIADLAATRDPNASLSQVAQVIMGASMGYTRMLKYDLKINPEDLIQYGLNATGTGTGIHINDPQTLLPALENYSKAKGLSGAAKDISHETWWGSWSSFIDRIQNFELDTGHGLFGSLKTSLNDLSSWIDAHSAQISRFSDLIGGTLAGAFKTVTGVVGDFMTGVGNSGLFEGLQSVLGYSPDHPMQATAASGLAGNAKGAAGLHQQVAGSRAAKADTKTSVLPAPENLNAWQQAGNIIGGALKQIGEGWDAVSGFFSPIVQKYVSDLGQAFQDFGNSLTPEDKQNLKALGGLLLSIPWLALTGLVIGLTLGMNFLSWVVNNIVHPLENFTHLMNNLSRNIQGLPSQLGKIKDQFTAWAGGLKDDFLTWGGDLITNLINGIKSKLGDLAGAVGDVANTIWSHLHQSTAEVGPLAHSDEWMPDMMQMFARQLHEGSAMVGNAAAGVANAIAAGMTPRGGYGGTAGLGGHGGGGSSGPVTVVYQINAATSQDVIRIVDQMEERRRQSPNSLSRVPGGVVRLGALGGIY